MSATPEPTGALFERALRAALDAAACWPECTLPRELAEDVRAAVRGVFEEAGVELPEEIAK